MRVIAFMRRLLVILFLLFNVSSARAMIKGPPDPSFNTHTVEALTAESPLILVATPGIRAEINRYVGYTLVSIRVSQVPGRICADPTPPSDIAVG